MRRGIPFLIALLAGLAFADGPDGAFPAPEYPKLVAGLGGGFTEALDHRCRLPSTPPAKLPYPVASEDMGNRLCKHHVWKLLMDTGAWNKSLGLDRARWTKRGRDARLARLRQIDAHFYVLDQRFESVLVAGRRALALYQAAASQPPEKQRQAILDAGLVKADDANGPTAGAPFTEFHEALRQLGLFAAGEQKLSLVQREDGLVAGSDVGTDDAPGPLSQAIARNDEVLAAGARRLYDEVQEALRQSQKIVNAPADAERASNQRDQKALASLTDVDLQAEGAAAVARSFDRAAAGGSLTPAVAASLKAGLGNVYRQEVNGKTMLVQDVRVPAPHTKTGYYTTYAMVSLKDGDTIAQAGERLSQEILNNGGWVRAFTATAHDVAAHPGKAAEEAARRVREDQGWFPIASGQTRGALERSLTAQRAKTVAVAGKQREQAQKDVRRALGSAMQECARLWSETERFEGAFASDREGARRLREERETLRVAGPNSGELVRCARSSDPRRDMREIRKAYAAAFQSAASAYAGAIVAADQKLSLARADVETTERDKARLRRVYFRMDLLELKSKGDLRVPVSNPALKEELLNAYFRRPEWSAGRPPHFYLDGWNAPPAGSKDPPFMSAAQDQKDGCPIEDEFIDKMAAKIPYWNRIPFLDREPAEDAAVRRYTRQFVEHDLEQWLNRNSAMPAVFDPAGAFDRLKAGIADRFRRRELQGSLDSDAQRWKLPPR